MNIDKQELKRLLFEKILHSGVIESYHSPDISIIFYPSYKELDGKKYNFSIKLAKRELFLTPWDLSDSINYTNFDGEEKFNADKLDGLLDEIEKTLTAEGIFKLELVGNTGFKLVPANKQE